MASLAVFGLGYVGSVTAACFASRGHQVIGVDTNPQKLDLLRQGIPPVAEPGLPELVEAAIGNRKLCVTHDVNEAVRRSDASFVSVGTPSRRNGDVDLSALESVLEEIGAALRDHDKFHTIVIRSTIPPGTTKRFVIPMRHMRGSLPEAVREAEVVVICSHDKEVEGILLAEGQGKQTIDLVGIPGLKHSGNGYSGIAW